MTTRSCFSSATSRCVSRRAARGRAAAGEARRLLHPVADDRGRAHDERRRVAVASSFQRARNARVMSVLPRPMSSARTPPAPSSRRNCSQAMPRADTGAASPRAAPGGRARGAPRARAVARAGSRRGRRAPSMLAASEALDPSLDTSELVRREARRPASVDERRALVDERGHLVVDLRERAVGERDPSPARRERHELAHLDLERAGPEVELGVEPARRAPSRARPPRPAVRPSSCASDSATQHLDARRLRCAERRECRPARAGRRLLRATEARRRRDEPGVADDERSPRPRRPTRARRRSVCGDRHLPCAVHGDELARTVERRARQAQLERRRLERRQTEDLRAGERDAEPATAEKERATDALLVVSSERKRRVLG